MLNEDNERLLSQLRKSNENAFKEIHAAYGKLVHFHALTILKDAAAADDVLQEVFIQLWEHRKQLPKELLLKTYLLDTVRQKCEVHLQAMRQLINHLVVVNPERDGFSTLASKELLERAYAAILHVYPPACKEILWLYVVEQKSYKEIAAVMNIQVAVVRNQICRGRKVLRMMLRLS
jgi:RNA polymerase sigma-70 factor (ECF subfamily)